MLGLLPPDAFSMDSRFAEILASRGLEASGDALGKALEEVEESEMQINLRALGYASDESGPPSPRDRGRRSKIALGRETAKGEFSAALAKKAMPVPQEVEQALAEDAFDAEVSDDAARFEAQRKRSEGFFYRDLANTVEYAETHLSLIHI